MLNTETEYKKVLKQIKDYEPGGNSYGDTLKYFVMSPDSFEALKEHIVDNKILNYDIQIKAYLVKNDILGIAAEHDRIIYDDDKEFYGENLWEDLWMMIQ